MRRKIGKRAIRKKNNRGELGKGRTNMGMWEIRRRRSRMEQI